MAQIFTHTIIDAESVDATYGTMTNQANVVERTVYVLGPYTGTVKIEASPVASGDDWYEVLSTTAVGAMKLTIEPLVCSRLRAKLTSMSAGPVTVKIACRLEPRT